MKLFCSVLLVTMSVCANALAQRTSEGESVKASSFGWNADDATDCLQRALDSGVSRVVVDKQDGDWIVRPIFVKGRRSQELLFEDGVTVRAKKGEFKGKKDSLFTLDECSDFTMRGEGNVQFVMRQKDYRDPKLYENAEWRHAIYIRGGANIAIDNFSIRLTGGDAVELAYNPRDVRISNLDCRHNYRQGISVCAAINLLVTNCVFALTGGTPPGAGLDIEPFRNKDRIENVVFEDCTFDNNVTGILFHLNSLSGRCAPVSCVFRRCKCRDNGGNGLSIYGNGVNVAMGKEGPVRGSILFEDCECVGNKIRAFNYVNVMTNGLRTMLRNCTFEDSGSSRPLRIASDLPANVAGLSCENVKVVGTGDVKPDFAPISGAGAVDLRGDLTFVDETGKMTWIDLEKWAAEQPQDPDLFKFSSGTVDFERMRPLNPGRVDKPINCGAFCREFTFVQCTPEAGKYKFQFDLHHWDGAPPVSGSFVLRDKLGTDLGEFTLKSGMNEYEFTSSANNLLRFEFKTAEGFVSVNSWARGCGVLASAPLRCFSSARRYYFQVPARAEEVRVKAQLDEATGALYNADGEKVAERTKDKTSNMMFVVNRSKTATPEVWSCDFKGNNWQVVLRIGAPALPIITTVKDAMIVER